MLNSKPGVLNAFLTLRGTNVCFGEWKAFEMIVTTRSSLLRGRFYYFFNTPNRLKSRVWNIWAVWTGKLITLTSCSLKIWQTSGLVRIEQLSINKIADFQVNWSFVRILLLNRISIAVFYRWNSAAFRYGFCRRSSMKWTPNRKPSFSVSR
jgi:hypothetical protein